jgi:hypothetical protein
MKKTILKYGIISGLISSLLMIATMPFEDRIGFEHGETLGYTVIVLSLLMVYFGVRSYRETMGGGWITFGRAFAVGISITVISCLCYVATWEVIYFNFTPGFVQKYGEHELQKAKAAGADDAAIAAKMAEVKRVEALYRNPFLNAAITFIEPFPVGLVVSLMSAALLRKRPREGQAPERGLAEA